jgi:PBP1b-binding outer membrane lipoprotein LpoB
MFKISKEMGRRWAGMASAVALAALLAGCARQEGAVTAQTSTQPEVFAQADIPEVIVTASRDSATSGARNRHE